MKRFLKWTLVVVVVLAVCGFCALAKVSGAAMKNGGMKYRNAQKPHTASNKTMMSVHFRNRFTTVLPRCPRCQDK